MTARRKQGIEMGDLDRNMMIFVARSRSLLKGKYILKLVNLGVVKCLY